MDCGTSGDNHKARALELAKRGIQSGADGDYRTALNAWHVALDYAEQHVPGDDIILWIRSGLGDALLRCGDYQGAADMASTALAFCASKQAPLALLTMTKACLELGDVPSARIYAQRAVELRGEVVWKQFSLTDQERLSRLE